MANVTRAGRFTFDDATGALLVSSSGGGASSSNLTQINGVTIAMSNSLPVELSDGTNPFGTVSNPLFAAITSGTLTAVTGITNQVDTNLKQVGGSNTATAATGTQKVGVVGNAGAAFDSATAATVPANAVLKGLRAATTYPTAVTDGQMVAAMGDKAGRQAVVLNAPRDLLGVQTTQIASSTSETTIVTAGATGVFNDITGIQITNATATAVTVTIKDATSGTTRKVYDLAANGGIVVAFSTPLPQAAAANNWTATLSVNTVTVNINIDYVKNK
jgi:hypothetical protein